VSCESSDRHVSVQIKIDGPVINSKITGVDYQSRRTRDPIFGRVLSEYLILPTMRELAGRIHRTIKTSGKQLRTFDFTKHGLEYLWQSLLQDQYWMAPPSSFTGFGQNVRQDWIDQHGDHAAMGGLPDPISRDQWLILRNVQLSPFVNRSPGKFYRGGWDWSRGHSRIDDRRFLVSASMWTWEDYAVRTLGIGDVRLPEQNGYCLMQVTSAYGPDLGVHSAMDRDGSHYAGGAAVSALGFPILVGQELQHRLDPFMASQGAVAVEQLTARLVRAPEHSGLLWARGVPKTVLTVSDEGAAIGITAPMPIFNAAWTVAADDDLGHIHYCAWGFRTGIRTFRKELETATKVISTAIKERGLRACFEFDNETNWFGETCLFSVSDMVGMADSLPRSDPSREAAEQVSYVTQYDNIVERETGLGIKQRNQICIALGEFEAGHWDNAYNLLSSIGEKAEKSPFVLDLRARTRWFMGDRKGGIELWRAALNERPGYELRDSINKYLRIAEELNDR
jgi:hypothetical protein